MPSPKTSYTKGIEAESDACTFLIERGYEILERRYKTEYGEIDVIARKQDILSFIEVKQRPSIKEALESISNKAKKRITNTTSLYLASYHEHYEIARFDVIAITSTKTYFLENAWRVDELH